MATAVERTVLGARDDVLVLLDLNCRPGVVGDRDPYLRRLRRVLVRADVVKASIEDLRCLDPAKPPTALAAGLVAERTRAVLVTAGSAATTIVTSTDTCALPVVDTPVVDTIGAGDSFTGAFLTWWMAGGRAVEGLTDVAALASAVDAAHRAAALTVGRRGADPPHRSDLPPDWHPG